MDPLSDSDDDMPRTRYVPVEDSDEDSDDGVPLEQRRELNHQRRQEQDDEADEPCETCGETGDWPATCFCAAVKMGQPGADSGTTCSASGQH